MIKTLLTRLVTAIIISGLLVVVFLIGLRLFGNWDYNRTAEYHNITGFGGWCNIAVIPIIGTISSPDTIYADDVEPTVNPDDIRQFIEIAESDYAIEGILFPIDSSGGTPVASEIISDTIKRSALPTVALIREVGASGAYLIATGADTIMASPFSDVGGIGVTMSYVQNVEENKKKGLDFVSLASAPYKDYGAPDKILTSAERSILERDLLMYHNYFVKKVAENRKLSIAEVVKLADGATVPGELALEQGLIDTLGDRETARLWFEKQIGDEVIFCEPNTLD